MPIGINPIAPKQTESALDKLLKGLQIAEAGLGVVNKGSDAYRNITGKLSATDAAKMGLVEAPEQVAPNTSGSILLDSAPNSGSILSPPTKKSGLSSILGDIPKPITVRHGGKDYIDTERTAKAQKEAKDDAKWFANHALEERKTSAAESAAGMKNKDADRLPEEQRGVVGDLAKDSAKKMAIANQMKALVDTWDKLSDGDKLTQGRAFLKVINSTQGADAIGTDEAKRLGAKLEFALGQGVYDPSRPVLGYDLPGFKEQVAQNYDRLQQNIVDNSKQGAEIYSKVGVKRDVPMLPESLSKAGAGSKPINPIDRAKEALKKKLGKNNG